MNEWLTASVWIGLALAAGLVSVRLGISVALTEIMFGVIGGNFLHLEVVPWVQMLAGFGSVFLTFLAGAEVDPVVLREKFKESVSIGTVAFLFPFFGAFAYAYWIAGWTMDASLIAGIALSTTSVAVVYAVMVETGLNETELGKIILAACFVNDLGTVLALGVFFADFNVWLGVFIGVSAVVLAATPKLTRWFTGRYGNRVSQMEAKYFFFLLFLLGGLALKADSEPVLPAYVQCFDVGLIPFLDNPVARAADPVKLYEYLAAGRPVVSRRLPFVEGLAPPCVYPYDDEEECLAAIARALDDAREAGDELRRRRLEAARGFSWDDRVGLLLAELRELTWLERSPAPSL